jgi:hypothetical protein
MIRAIRRLLTIAIFCCLCLYLGDYFSLLFQIPNHRAQVGSVTVERYYAVPLKNHKTEYMFDSPAAMACVYSLFPHFGDAPCWFLTRHRRQEIKLGRVLNEKLFRNRAALDPPGR